MGLCLRLEGTLGMGASTQGNSGPCCCTCPPSSPCLTESYRAKTDLPCPYAALSHSWGLAVLPWSPIRGGKLEVNGCLTPDLIVPSRADGAAPNCQAIFPVLKITSSPAISSPPFSLSSTSFWLILFYLGLTTKAPVSASTGGPLASRLYVPLMLFATVPALLLYRAESQPIWVAGVQGGQKAFVSPT